MFSNVRFSRRNALKMAAAAGVTSGIAGGALPLQQLLAQDAGSISFWMDITGGSETADCLIANVIQQFNDRGGVQVETTLQPNGWTATQTALAGGGGPDIVTTPGPSLSLALGKAGQIADLSAYAEQYGWAENFTPWALALGIVDGKLVAIPNEIETLVLYFNRTLFEENGWTPPTTIDELTALAQTVSDAGLIPFAHSNAEWKPSNEWFVGEFLNHGAGPENVYKALTQEIQFTDPVFSDALKPLTMYQQNGWFMGGLDRYYTTPTADATAALAYGDAAMKIEGTWMISDAFMFFEESGQEWDWVPMPSTDGTESYTLGIGSTYSVNANSANPDGAAEFLDAYFSSQLQAAAIVGCGMPPAPVLIEASELSELDERQSRSIERLNTASAEGNYGYTTWTFWPPATETYLIEEIEKVWAGDLTEEDYMKGMQDLFAEDLAAGNVPPIPERQ